MYYMLLVVFGMMGALSRYTLSLLIDTADYPLATLITNLAGSFLLAFVTQFLTQLPRLSPQVVSAVGTGFVGSFTTFSTFALESAELLQEGEYFRAASYISASLFGGLIACLLGIQAAKLLLIRKKGGKQ